MSQRFMVRHRDPLTRDHPTPNIGTKASSSRQIPQIPGAGDPTVVNLPEVRGVGQAFQPEPSHPARRRWKAFPDCRGRLFVVDNVLSVPYLP